MQRTKFITDEAIFVLKNYGYSMLLPFIIYAPSLFLMVRGLQTSIPDISLPPEARSVIIANLVEITLTLSILSMALFPVLVVASVASTEKSDKVFEQIFLVPISPLKLILYRFIAMIPLMALPVFAMSSLTYLVIAVIIGNVYLLYLLRMLALALMLALPLGYLAFFITMLLPVKYSSLLIAFFAIAPLMLTQVSMSLMAGASSTPIELFTLSVVITSIVAIMVGVIATFVLKDRIVELTMTSS